MRTILIAAIASLTVVNALRAQSPPATQPTSQAASGPVGPFKNIIHHGKILGRTARQPEATRFTVVYNMGMLFQLDKTHCLLAAGLEEQGGADLCVGTQGFVVQKLSDLASAQPIPLLTPEENYQPQTSSEKGYLMKGGAIGGFVPLDAVMADGKPHPAAGTGMIIGVCVAYTADRLNPIHAAPQWDGNTYWSDWEMFIEIVQLRWDGQTLSVTGREQVRDILGVEGPSTPFSGFILKDGGLIAPFGFKDSKFRVVRFDWDGKAWTPSAMGKPFAATARESEPCLQRQGDRYLVSTRGEDPKGRMYVSSDGMNFEPLFDWKNHYVPRILNKGLDGSLYLATNTGPGFLRNPLLVFPLEGDHFGQPVIVHDQDGVRDDKSDKIPFVDHAMASNVFLEGRWRHLLFYRVCDLKERTFYGFQKDLIQKFQGGKGPIPMRPTSGLYCAEIEYDKVVDPPFRFAGE
ncbi:MAG: hypothetical protein WC869_04015 [Phycisphaerae bacterium]|jgi:hypothetical protein